MYKPRVLFILKLRQTYGDGYTILKSSGLLNSATFVKDLLIDTGHCASLVQVVDNNSIDREVTEYDPDIVIIEALWVVPEKFEVLRKLHPNVKWIVRLHSELPFLASEGIALDWINKYIRQENVYVSVNSDAVYRDLKLYLNSADQCLGHKLVFLPNYYPVTQCSWKDRWEFTFRSGIINVGCFGAIRPMKNHLIQAAAAVQFAEEKNLKCLFHINAGRIEGRGDTVLKNLRGFFDGLDGRHELVEHDWLDRDEFLDLVEQMDIGMQVSFSETFNIVSADFINEDVPIVTSKEIDWMPSYFTVDPTNTYSIVRGMKRVMFYDRYFHWLGWPAATLKRYVRRSKHIWVDAIHDVHNFS